MGLIIIIILLIMLFGGGYYGRYRGYNVNQPFPYYGLLVVIVVVLLLYVLLYHPYPLYLERTPL
jgi:hypothetical protein